MYHRLFDHCVNEVSLQDCNSLKSSASLSRQASNPQSLATGVYCTCSPWSVIPKNQTGPFETVTSTFFGTLFILKQNRTLQ